MIGKTDNKNNNRGRRKKRFERTPSEYEQKIIDIRRTARVVAGGRRFSFRVSLVAGNRKGKVGVGLGKAQDTAAAIEKAFRNAKKNIMEVPFVGDGRIPHEVDAKYGSSCIIMKPAPEGRGLVAGSSVRIVLDLAGAKNVNAKILSRSKNKLNNARATIVALKKLKVYKVAKTEKLEDKKTDEKIDEAKKAAKGEPLQ